MQVADGGMLEVSAAPPIAASRQRGRGGPARWAVGSSVGAVPNRHEKALHVTVRYAVHSVVRGSPTRVNLSTPVAFDSLRFLPRGGSSWNETSYYGPSPQPLPFGWQLENTPLATGFARPESLSRAESLAAHRFTARLESSGTNPPARNSHCASSGARRPSSVRRDSDRITA